MEYDCPMNAADEMESLHVKLQELKVEHRDLDTAVAQLLAAPPADDLMLRRMKKRKLQIKDQIARIEAQLEPDIPA